jgi:2-keto-4-pentenoate hydratase
VGELTAAECQAAADELAGLWREGRHVDALPPALRPQTRGEGYAIQALLAGTSAEPPRGWKIAATSAAGQRHINVDGPLAGRLLAERIVPVGEPVRLGANRMRVAEVEFVFRLGRTLAPRPTPYGVADVLDAVAALHLGVEAPDSRFLDFTAVGAPQLIADNACTDWFVLGPEVVADWRALDLATHRVVGRTAAGAVHEGGGANVLGDPRVALAWLVNELREHGMAVSEGQIVTTGTCVVPLPVEPGTVVTGDYGDLGTIEVRFEA